MKTHMHDASSRSTIDEPVASLLTGSLLSRAKMVQALGQ